MEKIWFTADTHFSHKNILLHCPGRSDAGGFELGDIPAHNKWLEEMWNSTVSKRDTVYVLGDFAFGPTEDAVKLLDRLKGNKILIVGNHDKTSDHIFGRFKIITHIRMQVFKKTVFDFLDEDFMVFMCHYPMVTWASKHYGSVNLHGHCHGNLDSYNEESTDLRVDVGIDGKLANYGLVDLETVYHYFKEKTEGESFHVYAKKKLEEHKMIT